MQQSALENEPKTQVERSSGEVHVLLSGSWTADMGKTAEQYSADLKRIQDNEKVIFNLQDVDRLDTVGGWLIVRACATLRERGIDVSLQGVSAKYQLLIDEIANHSEAEQVDPGHSRIVDLLVDIGKGVVGAKDDFLKGISFFGEFVVALMHILVRPRSFRFTSLVNQLELVAFRSVPIITLMTFLVGCIIAQQGIFQLRTFGATAFVVDLAGILTLRELGVLLSAIMVSGRSGSAYTAELGSMKMREEIDALRVMGLDPMEVLVVPRILALVIGLPLLTFLASIAGLAGAGLTAYLYGGITPEVFLSRLQAAIAINTFFAGLIKAPFMALVIGVIACIEGFAVEGSSESLGRHVTSSVVKSIFMVIVMDGLFAIFYASINF